MHVVRPVAFTVLALAALTALACSRRNASISVGTCNDRSIACGVQIAREGDPPRELKCTPPDTHLPMSCACVEGGATRKTVSLATKLPTDVDEAEKLARSQCGW